MNSAEKIKQAKAMVDDGLLTEDDYQAIKNKLLRELSEEISNENNISIVNLNSTPNNYSMEKNDSMAEEPTASTGVLIVCFLFPIIGLILFCINRSTKPKEASSELSWALCGFAVGFFLNIL